MYNTKTSNTFIESIRRGTSFKDANFATCSRTSTMSTTVSNQEKAYLYNGENFPSWLDRNNETHRDLLQMLRDVEKEIDILRSKRREIISSTEMRCGRGKHRVGQVQLDQLKNRRNAMDTKTGHVDEKVNRVGSMPSRSPSVEGDTDTLVARCIDSLSSNFTKFAALEKVPKKFREQIVDALPVDLDEAVTSKNIHDEKYWKRCCVEGKGWKNCDLSKHGFTWKQFYFERNLEELLESFDPSNTEGMDSDELKRKIEASKDYIFGLKIEQFLSHEPLSLVFDNLPNLSRLELTYGVKRLRLRYDRALFGMKLVDAESLSQCASSTNMLSELILPGNLLDDDLLEILIKGLKENRTITTLDLSHNKITDLGAQFIAEMLGKRSVVMHLSLADNQIHSEGARLLGLALAKNTSVTNFNIRLNRLGDVGGAALVKSLIENKDLEWLNIAANSLGYESSLALIDLVGTASSKIEKYDVSANDFNEDDCLEILKVLEKNRKVIGFDLRKNMVSDDSEVVQRIASVVKENEFHARDLWMKKSK
eukprot:g3636.t1